jgi:hypothetical protein
VFFGTWFEFGTKYVVGTGQPTVEICSERYEVRTVMQIYSWTRRTTELLYMIDAPANHMHSC